MSGVTKLMTAGGGGVALTPASSIASDVTVKLPVTGVDGGTVVCSNSSGNVGIGTSSPSARATIKAAGNGYTTGSLALVGAVSGTSYITNVNGTLYFSNDGSTDQLVLDSSSNFAFNSGYGSAATAYGCRAWVNFNGTGTVAIRASGNVSSITDNGTGAYTVNFTNAMPDVNYSPMCSVTRAGLATATPGQDGSWAGTTTTLPVWTANSSNTLIDAPGVFVTVFR